MKIMSKPNSCKYCAHRVECDKSYKRYVHEGTEHKCFYELKNDKKNKNAKKTKNNIIKIINKFYNPENKEN